MSTRLFKIAGVALIVMTLPVAAEDAIGKVIAITGKATALGPDGKTRELALKSDIFMNDTIRTDKGSKLQIMLADDSVLSQGESAEMVIDEFTYDPRRAKGKESCCLKITRGVFRMVTGKITEMNPGRFKARTKMATIGIRGCEVGFRVRPAREDIYILYLPEDRQIVIEKLLADAAQQQAGEFRMLSIAKAGVAVAIEPGAALRERAIATSELRQLIQDSTPFSSGGHGQGERTLKSFESEKGSASLRQSAEEAVQIGREMGQIGSLNDVLNDLPPLPPLPEEPTSPPEHNLPPPDDPGPPVLVGGNPEMSDWEWGIWENGDVDYNPNRYLGATFISASEYADIANGAITYNLNGSGEAGAVVRDLESRDVRTLTGSCDLTVVVGGGATPYWGGDFSLQNQDGDALTFSVPQGSDGGAIDAEGNLSLQSLSAYSLSAFGGSFTESSLSTSSMEGKLIRGPNGSGPITAVAGQFAFEHGSSVKVNGAFGANLAAY